MLTSLIEITITRYIESGSFDGFFEETARLAIAESTQKTAQAYKVYTQDDFKSCPFKSESSRLNPKFLLQIVTTVASCLCKKYIAMYSHSSILVKASCHLKLCQLCSPDALARVGNIFHKILIL